MKSLFTVLSFLLVSPSFAAGDFPDVDIPYERHVLSNGFTLIIHEDHKAPIVAVNVWYHVGSKDERPGRTGFAHLFEHLMFNGSEHANEDFFVPLEAAGATKMNGTTWLDRTNYFENVPTSALDLTLWLESDRMGHLLGVIDQKKLDVQRGVVQNEKRQHENQPYGKAHELITGSTYPAGHPYSWTTIGSMEDLDAASLEDVKEWFRTYYGAANAVLVIAGDVDPKIVKEKVEHYFGDIAPGPVLKRQQDWIAKMTGTKRASLQDRVPQARLYKVWNIPGYKTHDFTLLNLAADVLGSGKNSRLYKRLVYADQTATAVGVGTGTTEIGSQFQVIVTVAPGIDIGKVERALDEEIGRFLSTGPTKEELERNKTINYAGFVRGIERIDGFGGKSYLLAESEVFGGSPDFYRQWLQWLRDATPAQIQSSAKRWLSDGVFILEVVPKPDYVTASTGAERSAPPALTAPPSLSLPALQRTTLSNGLKVVLAERHDAPLVQFDLLADAGFAADSVALGDRAIPGLAGLTLAMLDEGTTTRNALQIAERAETLGAALGVGSSLDTSVVSLNALTGKLAESLELFSDVLIHPTFPEAELERLRTQTLAAIQQEKTQPQGITSRVFPKLIYGNGHAYSNPGSGLGQEAVVSALRRADLQAFYARWLRPDNATLLVVGETTLAAIKPLLEQHLSAWKSPAESLPVKNLSAVGSQAQPRVFLVNRTGAEQSMIVAGYPGPARSASGFLTLRTLNTILGGKFISRLNMNLREDKHWAYGASSRLTETEGPGTFSVSAAVQTDKTAESIREILRELGELRSSRPPTAAELQAARDSLVLGLPGNNEAVRDVADSYGKILIFGLPDHYWNDYVREVSTLSLEQVTKAGQVLIRPEALTWVIVGDLTKIEDGIRKLKLGEVQVLDADGTVLR